MLLLRRLPGFSGRLGLRRSLSTAAARPPWIMLDHGALASESVPRAYVRVEEPPRVSALCLPANLFPTSPAPNPGPGFTRFDLGCVCSASSDGLLLLFVARGAPTPILANQVRQVAGFEPGQIRDTARFICNALTGHLSRLPVPDLGMGGPKLMLSGPQMGLLTQADRGHGPPNRFAVAELRRNMMLRFLSETGGWKIVLTAPYLLPLARRFATPGIWDQKAFPFGGRLWWVDLTWGAISADPFSDRPEPQFVELPTGSVLPARTPEIAHRELGKYRRMGVCEGRLRYAELSEREPFVLSVFALDQEGSGWTLEHRLCLVLRGLWADGGDPSLPLPDKTTPQICALDPLNANVIYLTVGTHVLGLDMNTGEVIGSSVHKSSRYIVPCVLPPWLGSSRIPPLGMNGAVKNKTLADVLVRSDRHQKT